eukprot:TRINITY_DN253_c0_g1_i1.p1 TRINITY_DN253_c0_g1~~TRINITY_DN253_c0_g1_i1.p1  ORF type:complete len:371 (+),score=75.07 TRINITY_DN253_c0_g1_i1:59-1114(+)
MEDSAVESITERLSTIADLHMPHSFACRSDAVSIREKKLHLSSLLRRDAAVFLERYGSKLSVTELEQFQVLGDDYEIGWHLKQLKSEVSPTADQRRVRAAAVKNRRLAYMSRLMHDGQYFSEDAMRLRSPLLHYELVGKYQDASARLEARPGERYSELLLRRAEEAVFQSRLKEEKRQAGIVDEDDDENISEHEEEEYDDDDEDVSEHEEEDVSEHEEEEYVEDEKHRPESVKANEDRTEHKHLQAMDISRHKECAETRELDSDSTLGETEAVDGTRDEEGHCVTSLEMVACDGSMQERLDNFTRLMQEKFLSGEDAEHVNYESIDNDQTLDDHWLVEVSRDAEDKYFEED